MTSAGWQALFILLLCVFPKACYGTSTQILHTRALDNKRVVMDNIDNLPWFNITVPTVQGYLPLDAPCDKPDDLPDNAKLYQYKLYTRDCADPWTMCLSEKSKVSLQQAIQSVIGTSVGARRYVDKYYFLDPNTMSDRQSMEVGPRDIWSFGLNKYPHFDAMASEISWRDTATSSGWSSVVDKDSCVVSSEAKSDYSRAFGQATVIRIFQLRNGFLPQGYDWSCMSNQLEFMTGLINLSHIEETCAIAGEVGKALKYTGPTQTGPFTSGFFGQTAFTTADLAPGVTPSATVYNRLGPDATSAQPVQTAQKSANSDSTDSPNSPGDDQKTAATPTPTPAPSKSKTRTQQDSQTPASPTPSATKTKSPSQTVDLTSTESNFASEDTPASQDSSEARQDAASQAGHVSSSFFAAEMVSSTASGTGAAGSAGGTVTSSANGSMKPGLGSATAKKEPSMYTTIVGNYDLNEASLYAAAGPHATRASRIYLFTVMIGVSMGVLL